MKEQRHCLPHCDSNFLSIETPFPGSLHAAVFLRIYTKVRCSSKPLHTPLPPVKLRKLHGNTLEFFPKVVSLLWLSEGKGRSSTEMQLVLGVVGTLMSCVDPHSKDVGYHNNIWILKY